MKAVFIAIVLEREREPERRSLSAWGARIDEAAMTFHEVLCEVEAKARSRRARVVRLAAEACEETRANFRRDAYSMVADLDERVAGERIVARRSAAENDLDSPAIRAVLHGVG